MYVERGDAFLQVLYLAVVYDRRGCWEDREAMD
jgi:hypothetical protein